VKQKNEREKKNPAEHHLQVIGQRLFAMLDQLVVPKVRARINYPDLLKENKALEEKYVAMNEELRRLEGEDKEQKKFYSEEVKEKKEYEKLADIEEKRHYNLHEKRLHPLLKLPRSSIDPNQEPSVIFSANRFREVTPEPFREVNQDLKRVKLSITKRCLRVINKLNEPRTKAKDNELTIDSLMESITQCRDLMMEAMGRGYPDTHLEGLKEVVVAAVAAGAEEDDVAE